MSNFQINFTLPWLLLFLIPALVFTLWPYFRLAKKYRRTRNRVISMVLHMVFMGMVFLLLAGMTLSYDIPNKENEIMLVVDASYSNAQSTDAKNEFVEKVLDEAGDRFKIGIVKFGFDQVYAAELSNDTRDMYQRYLRSEEVDDSATDIAAAMNFAKSQFKNPATAKIILISDGVETDGDAILAAQMAAADGIRVDTVSFPSDAPGAADNRPEIEILDVAFPDHNITTRETVNIKLTLQSSSATTVNVTLNDDRKGAAESAEYELKEGIQDVTFNYTFGLPGQHRLSFDITAEADTVTQNNTYISYIKLEMPSKILLLEKYENEARSLYNMLISDRDFIEADAYVDIEDRIKVVNIDKNPELVPKSVDEMRAYDQIMLVNISNEDMFAANMPKVTNANDEITQSFTDMLKEYVEDYGGGLFVAGGSDPTKTDDYGNPIPHAFNREDMATEKAKTYADMLPVVAEDYAPPVGVMLIVDRSGSMWTSKNDSGETYLQLAKNAAVAALDAFTYRDYIGVMALEDDGYLLLDLTSVQNKNYIASAIRGIDINYNASNTYFAPAMERAGALLTSHGEIAKRHIILITDGAPGDRLEPKDDDDYAYGPIVKKYYEQQGITLSVIYIKKENDQTNKVMETVVGEDYGHGSYLEVDPNEKDPRNSINTKLRADIENYTKVKDIYQEPYNPRVVKHDASIMQGITTELEAKIPKLGLFFGTRAKNDEDIVLMAPYVPLYSQWKYGKGMVGAFMTGVKGEYSDQFMADTLEDGTINPGKTILMNIVKNLMPIEDLRVHEISVKLIENNYGNRLDIFTNLKEDETLDVRVKSPNEYNDREAEGTKIDTDSVEGMGLSGTFTATEPGVYTIIVTKKDKNGNAVGESYEFKKAFSYSAEYNMFVEEAQSAAFMTQITTNGRGNTLVEAHEVFMEFETAIHKEIDPRLLFIILAIIVFLLDIAVRKFKFKWPHEIVRDYKEKQKFKNKQ